jgi:hypothetical protein
MGERAQWSRVQQGADYFNPSFHVDPMRLPQFDIEGEVN